MTTEESNLKKILSSPTLFSWSILNIKPTRQQAELLECDSNALVLWGRQCGKTTTLATKALHRAILRKDQEILIIAPTQRQSELMFQKIYEFCQFNDFVKSHTRRCNLKVTEFDSGSKIHCLPAGHEGASIRGFSATMVIFDEAALVPDAVFLAVKPSMAVRGEQIILSGTPYGKRGYFYTQYHATEITQAKHREWDIFKMRSSDSKFIDKAFLESERLIMTADQYSQEYDAEFVADSNSYFPYSLVMPAMEDYSYALPTGGLPAGSKLIMGVDIARAGSDETAIAICSVSADNHYKLLWLKTFQGNKITETAGQIIELATEYPDMKIYIDETGLGAGALDIVKEKNIDAIGVTFSTSRRNSMYQNLKMALEQKRVILSSDDRKLASQFGNYTGKAASDGSFRIVKGNGHDDCVDALAMCFCGEADIEWELFDEGLQLNPFRRNANQPRYSFGGLYGI